MFKKILSKIGRKIANTASSVKRAVISPDIHYASHLPRKTGFFSEALRRYMFKNISIDEKQKDIIQKIPENAIIIYTSKYRSHFEYLFYFTRFKKTGLPHPSFGFNHRIILWQPSLHLIKIIYSHFIYFIKNLSFADPFKSGHMRDQLLKGRVAIMALIGKRSFNSWFLNKKTDPIQFLIDLQKTTDKPIYIVPEIMFFSLKPKKTKPSTIDILFGPLERPGKLRRLYIFLRGSKNSFIEIVEPVRLDKFIETSEMKDLLPEEQASAVRRHLVASINKKRQTIIGPVLKARDELKQSILTSEEVESFLKQHAEENDMSIQKVNKKADKYLEEIAANYSSKWIAAFQFVLAWLFKNIFEGIVVDQKGLARVKEQSIKAPLILVPCHKSHLDYLILSYVFHTNNMPCPHIAAGKNLSFWPMGTIFRGGGAFFMRRTFKGAELYAKIFSEYMKKLLSEGFNIELFIEGTRSRTGKLLPPKFGLMSILVNAFKENACEDLLIVPVFFGYDRVLEEEAYLHEVEGGDKEPESVGQIFKARQVLKKRYGKVYVNFHEPVSLKQYIKDKGIEFEKANKQEQQDICNGIGYKAIQSIHNVSLATPYGIVASGLLNNPKKRFSHKQLMSDIDMYMNYLENQDIWLAETLETKKEWAFNSVIDDYIRRKFIDLNTDSKKGVTSKSIYKVNRSKRPVLGYYKNNSINFFISGAYTALSILKLDAFQFESKDLNESYSQLQIIFDTEFAFDREMVPEQIIRKDIKAFIDQDIITPHSTIPDTYDITPNGYRKLKSYANFLTTFLESYLIVLNFYKHNPGSDMDTKSILKKVQSIGKKMYKNNDIELSESLSDITFKNAIRYFSQKGLAETGSENNTKFYINLIQDYLSLTQN